MKAFLEVCPVAGNVGTLLITGKGMQQLEQEAVIAGSDVNKSSFTY